MTGYYTGDISQIYRILAVFDGEFITTAEVWRRSKIQHARGKPMLYRMVGLGLIAEEDSKDRIKKGINKIVKFYHITTLGIEFKEMLEIYVLP